MEEKKENKKANYFLIIIISSFLITGSINTIFNKLQIESVSLEKKFTHPYFVTFCMFIGEITCFFWYILVKPEEEQNFLYKPKLNPFIMIVPAICDLIGCTMMTFGLTMISSSIHQMLRGSLILFTGFLSIFYLGNKLYRHHYLGMLFVFTGISLVGLSGLLQNNQNTANILGIFIVIVSQIFIAFQISFEEKYLKKYSCHPLETVYWEGIWGALFYLLLLIAFQFSSCPNFMVKYCSDDGNSKKIENTYFALKQIVDNYTIAIYISTYMLSIGLYNFAAMTISKISTANTRAVIDPLRTIFIWIFFLIPFPFLNEEEREHFYWLQLVGFFFILLGTLLYNEILTVPILGLDKYLKKNLLNRESEGKDESLRAAAEEVDALNVNTIKKQ